MFSSLAFCTFATENSSSSTIIQGVYQKDYHNIKMITFLCKSIHNICLFVFSVEKGLFQSLKPGMVAANIANMGLAAWRDMGHGTCSFRVKRKVTKASLVDRPRPRRAS